jgi:hypothetical protein
METSVRYAQDQAVDVRFLDDSKLLPKKLEISVTTPYVPSEFDQLFSSDRLNQWAFFTAPPNFGTQARTLFSYQLIPSLGTYEKQEADIEKLMALQNVLINSRRPKDEGRSKKQPKQQQEDQDQEGEETERQTLLALFKCIEMLDRTLTFINSRRNQYQRG